MWRDEAKNNDMEVDIYIWILPATGTESTSHGTGNGKFGKQQTVATHFGPSQTVEGKVTERSTGQRPAGWEEEHFNIQDWVM